jgi:hypothetical protein
MSTPRSLADDLRRRNDAELEELLRLRPDLLYPVPPDFTALTSRATAGPSVSRCLDTLDSLHLHVLRTAADLTSDGARGADEIIDAAGRPLGPDAQAAVSASVADLVARALLWGNDDALRSVAAVAELVREAPVPAWPAPDASRGTPQPTTDIDRHAGLRARESLALTRDLLEAWSVQPPTVLRTGGLALRDLAAARALLHEDWSRTALTIEVAQATRLVADDGEEQPAWVPTDRFDTWLELASAQAWVEIVDGWVSLPRLPSLADAKARLLTSDNDHRRIVQHRRVLLDLLLEQEPGAALTFDEILAVLDHRRPRQGGRLREQVVGATLREADDLGLLGFGALSTAGRLAVQARPTDARERAMLLTQITAALASAMPADVDHVLIQGDLTITAPGPLTALIARRIGLLADIESRGHATVYRVSDASIRRALDAGFDAEAIHAFLREVSRTPVPQPLTYLIDDAARRHGTVRVGAALAYLRSDTPDTLTAMLEDRRLAALGLHRIAPTVLVGQAPVSEMIASLRAAGYAPAVEAADGGIVIRRPQDHRTRTPAVKGVTSRRSEATLVSAAVRTLRAGDRAQGPRASTVTGPASSEAVPRLQSSAIVAALRQSIAETRPVWLGYADTDGTVADQVVDPIRLSAGVLTAFDHRTSTVRTFAVSRITGIADPL